MSLSALIRNKFPYQPTAGQEAVIDALAGFLEAPASEGLFLLKGYAGTGKTSLVSSLVGALKQHGMECVLLAPTGRAAKVFSSWAAAPAYTIHRKIYRLKQTDDGLPCPVLQANRHRHCLFLVDEASMISARVSGDSLFSSQHLLDDLIAYVQSGQSCRLVLIGDTAQLPPVGETQSPAMSASYLHERYGLRVLACELKEVVRQSLDSGILLNATGLRGLIQQAEKRMPAFQLEGLRDVIRLDREEAGEAVEQAFAGSADWDSLIICRSNKRANLFNAHIRRSVLFREGEINSGDRLMILRNNYYWLAPDSRAGFLANGDIAEVMRIQREEEMYGFRFAEVSLQLTDYPEEPLLDAKIMLDTLNLETPALGRMDARRLYEAVAEDYAGIARKAERLAKIRTNPYLQALQVKFAYALTCHKAQGGQWDQVFVDLGYLPDKQMDTESLRWLYTAITRARNKLYLLGFPDDFFKNVAH